MTSTYGYGSPHFYDLTGYKLRPDSQDVRFHLEYAKGVESVVEVGAGTGRIALEMAAGKVHVYCIEPSVTMRSSLLLKIAQRPEVHPFITVLPEEAADFELGKSVPLAYAVGVMQHFLTDEEMLDMLRNIRRHLEPGGVFLFDAMGAQKPGDVPPTLIGEERVGEMLYRSVYEMKMLSQDYYRFKVTYETLRGDRIIETIEDSSVRRYVHREDMHRLLYEAGFEISGERVAYDGSPYTGREPRIVIEAKRIP